MTQCAPITFETLDSYQLHGLLFKKGSPKRGLLFVHGLTSSVFAQQGTLMPLVDETTCALFFNNRGNGIISKVKKMDPESSKGYSSEYIGSAHEVFTDSMHDIQAAIDVLVKEGVEDIYIVGHSTGCQKTVHYAGGAEPHPGVKGVILICPLSDYAYASVMLEDKAQLAEAIALAKDMVANDQSGDLMPSDIWPETLDAQRLLSLYTPDSPEEIFSYSHNEGTSDRYSNVTIPILALFAGADQMADRSPQELIDWFTEQNKSSSFSAAIIDDAIHTLTGFEPKVAEVIDDWINRQ